MKIAKNLIDLIGNTPLMKLQNYSDKIGVKANIIVKIESFNPLGSAKDRVGYAMIADAEERGLLTPETVIVESTSGNTGVGLAYVCAIKGYRLVLTMPETMSIERRRLLSALGAEIILTPGNEGMTGAIQKADSLLAQIPNSFKPDQFNNTANAKIHKLTTGKEILRDTDGNIDIFVAGVGTGGTLTGVGEALKEHNKNIHIVAVEPYNSAVLSGEKAGTHGLQGIGAGFIPSILNQEIIDEMIKVTDDEAMQTAKAVAKSDGLLVGISSGAALFAALKLGQKEENTGKNIVVLLPDTGERYLSTALFSV